MVGQVKTVQLPDCLLIQQTYTVTLDVLDASGPVIATASEPVATPTVPNPAAT